MRYLFRRRITLLVLLILSLVTARFLTGCGEGLIILTEGSAGGVNWSDWSYRRSVTITNSGTTQSDYQVNINLAPGNFTFANADANGNDLRFNYNGTSLPYWIESWVPDTSASIWVMVPSIVTPSTVIYLYYGNPGLTSESNFDNTFTKDSGFSGLVAQWHMDEGSGSIINDSSPNTNDGTIINATWAGVDGGRWYTSTAAGFSTGDSLTFDGSGDYVTVTDDNTLDSVSNITIAAWINTSNDVSSTTQFIVSKWTESGNQRSYSLGLVSGKLRFYTSSDGTSVNQHYLESASSLAANTWYHVAVTSDVTFKKIYINGTIDITSASGTYSINSSGTSDLYLGLYDLVTFYYYKSIIDEVSIYSLPLNSDQIKALSQRSKYSSTVGIPSVGGEELVP